MKNLLFLFLPLSLFAQSFMLSNIPLPKTYIQDLDPYECNEKCMKKYVDEGMFFSFLSHATTKLEDKELNEMRVLSISILNLASFYEGEKFKIALLLPYKKIGKYASSTTNAAFAYLMTKSHPFTLKSYKVETEEVDELAEALDKIYDDGFRYVIAPLTKEGAQNVIEIDPYLNIYFPTINKKDVNTSSSSIVFGAIDYAAQSNLLLEQALSPLVIFSDRSSTGKTLALHQTQKYLKEDDLDDPSESGFNLFSTNKKDSSKRKNETLFDKNVIKIFISKRTTNIESYLKDNKKIIDGTFMINTPIIKTGMILSQVTLYDVKTTNILSTQINYDPLLLSMTQYVDREHMLVANSITEKNNILIETNSLVGNDIVYDWINYTTTVGVDYLYSLATAEQRIYTMDLVDNQISYDIELLQPSKSRFVKYPPLNEERK